MKRPIKLTAVALSDKIAEWSLYIMVFAIPFSKSIAEITMITAILSVVVKKIMSRDRAFKFDRSTALILAAYLAISALSVFNTPYLALTIRSFFSKSVKFVLLFLAAQEIIDTKEKAGNFVIMAAVSCVIISFDCFIQYFITHIDVLRGHGLFGRYPTASFQNPTDFGAWVLIFLLPACVFAFQEKLGRAKRAVAGVIFAMLAFCLILSKVRGAWLSFMAALSILPFFRMRKAFFIMLITVAAAGSLVAFVINKNIIHDSMSPASAHIRIGVWKVGWEIFRKHPVVGNGVNSFFNMYKDMSGASSGTYAHNCYLQMAAETGILGLASFLLFVFTVMLRMLESLRTAGDSFYNSLIFGVGLGLAAFLMHSFVDTDLYSLNLAALFWLMAGFLLAVIRINGPER